MIKLVLFLSYTSSEVLGYDKTMRLLEGNKFSQQPGSGPRAVRAGHSFGRAEPLNWLLANLAWLSNWAALSGSEPAKPVKNSMLSPTLFHRLYALPPCF